MIVFNSDNEQYCRSFQLLQLNCPVCGEEDMIYFTFHCEKMCVAWKLKRSKDRLKISSTILILSLIWIKRPIWQWREIIILPQEFKDWTKHDLNFTCIYRYSNSDSSNELLIMHNEIVNKVLYHVSRLFL